jgi:predicted porin
MFNLGEFSMKKTLVAIAALAATASFAQSSVTISGIMDLGVVYNNAAAPGAPKLSLGAANNNRIIFSGVEDLGGGMAATFAAQMRFDPRNGGTEVGGSRNLFQGETRVGLRGDFGAIRLGRGLTALQAPNGGYIDPWGVSTVAGSVYAPGYATDYVAGGEGRTDGIFYDSPNFSGFQVSVTYSPRTVANSSAVLPTAYSKTFTSIAATYNNGPFQFLIGQENNRQGDKLFNLGGNYNLGVAKIYAGYGQVKGGTALNRTNSTATNAVASAYPGGSISTTNPSAQSLTGNTVKVGAKITAFSVGASIPMGAATIRAGFSSINPDALQYASNKTDQKLGLGVEYALSKRTALYTDFASLSRKNNAANTGSKATDNSRATSMDFGITHRF